MTHYTEGVTVHGYVDNTGGSEDTPKPMVHVMGVNYGGEFQSLSFTPQQAEQIAAAISVAAQKIQRGENVDGSSIEFRPEQKYREEAG